MEHNSQYISPIKQSKYADDTDDVTAFMQEMQ